MFVIILYKLGGEGGEVGSEDGRGGGPVGVRVDQKAVRFSYAAFYETVVHTVAQISAHALVDVVAHVKRCHRQHRTVPGSHDEKRYKFAFVQ